MNNASVEYVRRHVGGESVQPDGVVVPQAGRSDPRLHRMGAEIFPGIGRTVCPAFTTIINNIYLILVPVGILIGSRTEDLAEFVMTFIFYLIFVPAIAGVLNKIMYISESFTQIDGKLRVWMRSCAFRKCRSLSIQNCRRGSTSFSQM